MPPFWPSVRLYPQHKVAAGGLFSRKALTEWQETEREVRPTSPDPHLDRANFSSVPRGVGFSGWLAAQPDRGHIGEMPARTGPCRRRPGMIERKAMLQKFFNAMTQKTGQTGERRSTAPIMSKDDGRPEGTGPGTSVITKTKPRTKRPSLYRVLILNDDYTPMEFVVHVLERFFQKDVEAATKIMLHVHHHGIGECGIFTYEIAETKVTQVMDFARKHQHPLQCVMEKK